MRRREKRVQQTRDGETQRNEGSEEVKGSFHQQVSSIFMIQISDSIFMIQNQVQEKWNESGFKNNKYEHAECLTVRDRSVQHETIRCAECEV